uniref:KH domain-containing protein n=1 Tax=Panagrellus redivivus TaxID=6233 RepID=A0A7E4W1K5_PANRE
MPSPSRSTSPDSAASSDVLCGSDSGTTVSSSGPGFVAAGPVASVSMPNVGSRPEVIKPWVPKTFVPVATVSQSNNGAPKPRGPGRGPRRQQNFDVNQLPRQFQQRRFQHGQTFGTNAAVNNRCTVAGEKLAELMRLCNHEYAANESYYHAINALLREIQDARIPSSPSSTVVAASPSSSSENSAVSSPSALKIQPIMPPPPQTRDMPFTASRRIPIPENPHFNLIGRILGPRGLTVRELETKYQCRIYVRGQGSIRDPKKAEALMDKPGWEHLREELHVLVIAGGNTQAELDCRLEASVHFLNRLLHPQCFDAFKRRQLVSLALMNGTFRPHASQSSESSTTTTKFAVPPPPQALAVM